MEEIKGAESSYIRQQPGFHTGCFSVGMGKMMLPRKFLKFTCSEFATSVPQKGCWGGGGGIYMKP